MALDDDFAHSEQQFQELLRAPCALSQNEYETRVERFHGRLTIDDIMALTARRVRGRPGGDSLEKRALIAIAEGRFGEVDRLFKVIDRRNAIGLTVVKTPSPASPPRSS